jgi:hypothetical protein
MGHCCGGVVVGVKGKGVGKHSVRIEMMREGRCGVGSGSRTSLDTAYGMGQVIKIKEKRAFVFGCRPEAAATRWLEVAPGLARLVERGCRRPESLLER